LKFRSIFIFLVIAVIAGLINYFTHISNLHIHLGHVSFLAIVFSYSLGFKYGIFMIIAAHIIPELLAAHADLEMLISALLYTLSCFLAVTFNFIPIVTLGIILTIIQQVLSFFLERLSGTPIHELITEDGVEFLMLIIFFVSLGNPLVNLLKI
jgi:hypothetical protein